MSHESYLCYNDYWECSRCLKRWFKGEKLGSPEPCAFTVRRTFGIGGKIERFWLTGRIKFDTLVKRVRFRYCVSASSAGELFLKQIKKGDEFWEYTTPQVIMNRSVIRHGESGVAIVRDRKVFDTMATCFHMVSVYYEKMEDFPRHDPFDPYKFIW